MEETPGRNCFVSDSFGREKMKCSELKATYPGYFMSKNKIQLTPSIDVDSLLKQMEEKYVHEQVNNIDGLKIDFNEEWIHLRKSNTEPIIRIYTESKTAEQANALAEHFMVKLNR